MRLRSLEAFCAAVEEEHLRGCAADVSGAA